MTFLEALQSHKGGLIRLKAELYWYDGRGWDKNPGHVCLLLDATDARTATAAVIAARTATTAARTTTAARRTAAALLLIDGSPQRVWVDEADIEILVNDQPTN